jgi:hypothetical protein
MHNESLLEFPCNFPIKVMGHRSADFHLLVADIVGRHVPDLDVGRLRYRDSRNGRYRSVTVVIQASSRAQLDAIYQDLSRHERVVMAL